MDEVLACLQEERLNGRDLGVLRAYGSNAVPALRVIAMDKDNRYLSSLIILTIMDINTKAAGELMADIVAGVTELDPSDFFFIAYPYPYARELSAVKIAVADDRVRAAVIKKIQQSDAHELDRRGAMAIAARYGWKEALAPTRALLVSDNPKLRKAAEEAVELWGGTE